MRISNVRVSYSTSLIKESVNDAIELAGRVKKRNRRVAVCMIAAVIATMIVATILMGNFESAFVVGVVVSMFLWGGYCVYAMAVDSLLTTEGAALYREIRSSYINLIPELEEIQTLAGNEWLKAFLNTDAAEAVVNNAELALIALDKDPVYIEVDLDDPDDVILRVTTSYSAMCLDVDVCHFNVEKYTGDGSDLLLCITDDELILCKGDIELKPVEVQVE